MNTGIRQVIDLPIRQVQILMNHKHYTYIMQCDGCIQEEDYINALKAKGIEHVES
jgi:hypothetical protein